MPERLQCRLVKTFALGRMCINGCSDVFKARPHLDRKAEDCRQFGDAGADALDAEQQVVVGPGDDPDEAIFAAERKRAAVCPEWEDIRPDLEAPASRLAGR